ncbi:MAG TPA: amino acid adenylation domain-containing protein, partial [Longimicrobiaceae bacterium]|nr:amino acid adenylation domain-containing protein [Longimicrobiaceae bacterium]
ESAFRLVEHDLDAHPDAKAELRGLIAEEADAPFDLEVGPLFRGRLIRMAEDDHVLLLTMHHVVSDAWSTGVLLRELSTLYGAFRRGEADPLPPLPVQYADYAAWQRRWVDGEVLARQADYWQRMLAGAPEVLELPTDRPRPALQDHTGAVVRLALDEALTAGLKALGRRHGTTPFMTLLAGWATVLSRLSRQLDVVVGTPTANRGRSEIEGLIGFFVNTLALRLDLSGSPSVAEVLGRVRERALGAQQHQDIPFEQVVERVRPVRSLAHTPLFQVMFAWQNALRARMELPGLALGSVGSESRVTAKFDLSLTLQEAGGRIVGSVEYATALFEPATVERHGEYLRRVLEEMVADDRRAIDLVPILPDAERRKVLEEWNATDAEFPAPRCIHDLFEMQAARAPDAVAVVFGGEQLTYRGLNARANQLAHHLRERGVGPDARVAICAERGLEMMVGMLAILKAGGAYVPLDPAYPEDRLRYMLQDSAPVALLAHAALGRLFTGAGVPLVVLDEDELWADRPETDPERDHAGPAPEHLAYVIYTSGSTGQPKGVMIEHRSLVNAYLAWEEPYELRTRARRHLQMASFSFDVFTGDWTRALCSGGTLVVCPRELLLQSEQLYALMQREEVQIAEFVPAVLRELIRYLEASGRKLDFMRALVCGSDTWSVREYRHFLSFCGPQTRLVNSFGLTEATIDSTFFEAASLEGLNGDQHVPIGRPFANTTLYVLDAHREPVPVGVAGELYVGGRNLARGYRNRPELTAEKFTPDPFSGDPGARLYRTGDGARWRCDGNVEFLGRIDTQVKVRGFRVELGEIEARLAEHPAVHDAVVVAREDTPGDRRLVAYYLCGEGVEAEALRVHLSERLPEYMVPAAYVRLEALPLTPNGKVNRKALPAPEEDAFVRRGYEPPFGETEVALAEVWSEVLNVERVGRRDNFFELGGHSLLAVRLTERMRRRGLHAEVRALFTTPTLTELAAVVGRESFEVSVPPNGIPTPCEAITPEMIPLVELSRGEIDRIVAGVPGGAGNVQDVYPLAPLQEGILFHHLLAAEGDPYLLVTLSRFDCRARLDAYLAALQAVIDRHDVLRTAVVWEGLPEPVQVVWREARLEVEEVELDPAGGDVATQLRARFDPRSHRLDVRRAPMMRVHVARDGEGDGWVMLWQQHHLIGDHVSSDVLREEIRAHLRGCADELPAPLPFRNYVAQARLGVSRAEHEAYFRELLGDVDEPTAPFGL